MVGEPLLELLRRLKQLDYDFVAVTPATHARVLARPWQGPASLRDIFGWSRPFAAADLDRGLLDLLAAGGAAERSDDRLRSSVRVASLGPDLLLHSAFPTDQPDSVFFGPDTYRFARFLGHQLGQRVAAPGWIVDMGCGSGAGGIVAARACPEARITLVDINPAALRLASLNAAAAGVAVETLNSPRVPAGADLVIANPPYMLDRAARRYRDGGGLLGGAVALDWARQALAALAPGGTLLLYTGAAVVDGGSPLLAALAADCAAAGARLVAEEIDPDVFGEELEQPAYCSVDRIAAVGAVITAGPAGDSCPQPNPSQAQAAGEAAGRAPPTR